ncbi:NIPSNAP family protein [Mycobacterium sp. E2479]|uniref:NIPSNAP family protein n=1 Tax=Mycobacterium sp. E2479 TaxID=1834134 RepID=UPI0007FD3776|nr:NIPSNAP family protein [Mycobacterium sp. E2479]OBH51739.1 NIPSNAP domain-containing protein [Mycobacterium sp. E2479]
MLQLRIYTLRSSEALRQYATVHWARHLDTFRAFGVTTHGVWTEQDEGATATRLVALVGYPEGVDPEQLTRRVMASAEFRADMAGFDVDDIIDVESILVDPAPFSPIR